MRGMQSERRLRIYKEFIEQEIKEAEEKLENAKEHKVDCIKSYIEKMKKNLKFLKDRK